ncbi:hypothetical protein C8R44DRAFT_900000, partial [Mycena epipterygia]
MSRVGITLPAVTMTADDQGLKAGKPRARSVPLAAKCLGYKAFNCVVLDYPPSGALAFPMICALATRGRRLKLRSTFQSRRQHG